MKAIVYSAVGGPDVLRLVDRPVPEPLPGEVRVRVRVSAVNPTDWKSRRGLSAPPSRALTDLVPNQDGAGVVDAVGEQVTLRAGQRVWLRETARQRTGGTAQEYVVVPEANAVPLPDGVSFDVGAALGVPAMTAHRTLTVAEGGPVRLGPGALEGRTVLVAGGAGAVGHAAIQLARWSGARVLATVSGDRKAELATRAGAHHVVGYRDSDAAALIRRAAPDGVDLVVEVAAAANAGLDTHVVANGACVAVYADDGGEPLCLPVRPHMITNTRYQFVLLYTLPEAVKAAAAQDISRAAADGALAVGDAAGLPLHRFDLAATARAHAAAEAGAGGKVLIDVAG
jgi:NADPH2:quinone reductase